MLYYLETFTNNPVNVDLKLFMHFFCIHIDMLSKGLGLGLGIGLGLP